MTVKEFEKVMGKLITATDAIADELSELVEDRASGIPKTDARRLKARVAEIQKEALNLRIAFDQYQ